MTTPDGSPASNTAEVGVPNTSSPGTLASTSPEEEQQAVAPVRIEERIFALDTIRGFAARCSVISCMESWCWCGR
jgi:hypothetical protein